MSIVLTVMLFQITVPYKNDEGAEREGTMYEKTGGVIYMYVCIYVYVQVNLPVGEGRGRRARVSDSIADFTG